MTKLGPPDFLKEHRRFTNAKGATVIHHGLQQWFSNRGYSDCLVLAWHQDGGALCMKTYGHLRDEHSQAQALKVAF